MHSYTIDLHVIVSKSELVVSRTHSSSQDCFNALPLPKRYCFSVRPLTDPNLVEQLAVRGTCVFPLLWRVSDHNTALQSSRAVRHILSREVWTEKVLWDTTAGPRQHVVQAGIGLRTSPETQGNITTFLPA